MDSPPPLSPHRLRVLGLLDARVPRYTSYPTAPAFGPTAGTALQAEALAALDPADPVSVYVHIPFCERLCWFCACRTQGTKTLGPVEDYVATLEAESARVAALAPRGVRMGRLHWGGGTPTILPPALIHRLMRVLRGVFEPVDGWEFSVEIDPTLVDRDKIAALAAEGMTRASLGVQDFDPEVQGAIGRIQSFEATAACVGDLRAAGVGSLNLDLVYGLPHQTEERIARTAELALSLAPDRVALFGYAHVPWVAKRQRLIDEAALPGDEARHRLSTRAGAMMEAAGLVPIGIDHFAQAGDGLARAAVEGRLRRNFQGYTDDGCATLVGLGASAISRFPSGYAQNAAATPAYATRIAAGGLAGARGHVLTPDDRLRGRAIEMLMCDFALDLADLVAEHGDIAYALRPAMADASARFGDLVSLEGDHLAIRPEAHAIARMVAQGFDAYELSGLRFSQAS